MALWTDGACVRRRGRPVRPGERPVLHPLRRRLDGVDPGAERAAGADAAPARQLGAGALGGGLLPAQILNAVDGWYYVRWQADNSESYVGADTVRPM